jgi:uncharacterized membrane protein
MSERAALYLHLLGAFTFVSGSVAISVLRFSAINATNNAEILTLLKLGKRVVPVVAGGFLLTAIFGCWLAQMEHYWNDHWVVASLVLVGWMLIVGGVAGREDRKTREMAQEAVDAGASLPDEKLVERLRNSFVGGMNTSMLIAIFVVITLMVFKPGKGN